MGRSAFRQREQALARFRSQAVAILVATDVAARGIDVKNISQDQADLEALNDDHAAG